MMKRYVLSVMLGLLMPLQGIAATAGSGPQCNVFTPRAGLIGDPFDAVSNGRIAELVACGLPVNADIQIGPKPLDRQTLLQYAVGLGQPKIVAQLLDAGADPNYPGTGKIALVPLELAISMGKYSVADLLLRRGASATYVVPHSRMTALMSLAFAPSPEAENLLKLLLADDAELNARDETGATPLHWAVRAANAPYVRSLLEQPGIQCLRDRKGKSPAELASKLPDDLRMQLRAFCEAEPRRLGRCKDRMLPADFDPESQVAWGALRRRTPIVALALLSPTRSPDLRRVLAAGHPPSVCALGVSALSMAASSGSLEAVDLLLQAGAHPDRPLNADSTSPLMAAFSTGNLEAARRLLDQGAVATLLSDAGFTSLHFLLGSPYLDDDSDVREQIPMARTLIAAGVDINGVTTARGLTALMLAATEGRTALVDMLLSEGARVDLRDERRRSALDFAQARSHKAAAALLTLAGAKP